MAFRDWLTADGTFMPLYPWLSSAGDKFIEHGHRLLAMLAGVLTIGLVIVCRRCEPRRWVRLYSVGLLAGVVLQGVLGGMRVVFDERVLALVHGCVGPLFFAAAAGLVVVTSRSWSEDARSEIVNNRLVRLAAATAVIAYLQLVLGAVVRHSPHMLGDGAATIFQTAVYFHLLLAAVVTFHVVVLAAKCVVSRQCTPAALGLVGLILLQVLLGASSWVVRYGMPSWATRLMGETGHFNRASDFASAAILAGHGAIGALIVALSVAISLKIGRTTAAQRASTSAPGIPLTGALA
jgi:cytochrome c oxidase assembly protein subunit 15